MERSIGDHGKENRIEWKKFRIDGKENRIEGKEYRIDGKEYRIKGMEYRIERKKSIELSKKSDEKISSWF